MCGTLHVPLGTFVQGSGYTDNTFPSYLLAMNLLFERWKFSYKFEDMFASSDHSEVHCFISFHNVKERNVNSVSQMTKLLIPLINKDCCIENGNMFILPYLVEKCRLK
jgi:hypothetical protein